MAYPVMQAYSSLALEDNLRSGEVASRRPTAYNGSYWERTWWFSLFLKWGLPVWYAEGLTAKIPGMVLEYFFKVL